MDPCALNEKQRGTNLHRNLGSAIAFAGTVVALTVLGISVRDSHAAQPRKPDADDELVG